MTDHSDLIAELRDLLTDWNGADLPDSELPRVDILCGTIRRAASALSSQSLSLSEAREEIERQKTRGDNHWETLRGIRDIARTTGDLERIVLWVNDAGSGYTERPEATIASLTDRVNDAEKALEPFSVGADVFYRNEPDEKTLSLGRWTDDGRFYADVALTVGHVRRAKAVLENSKAGLADATNDPADLSSLRKGSDL